MIIYILEILFVCFLFRMGKKNKCYYILCAMQALSFLMAPLVENQVHFFTATTIFNVLYSFIILSLIIIPWRYPNFEQVYIKDVNFFRFYKRCLYFVLKLTILNNLIVLAIVLIFIPDIAHFKASQGFHELYDRIPLFGLLFRYTSVSRNIGLMAMPIWIYYLQVGKMKEARKALVMSSSTLIAAIAFYSRAQILGFTIIIICLFYLMRSSMSQEVTLKIETILKRATMVVFGGFMIITVLRFSGMDYYGDRIPSGSFIQDPIMYSIVDYTSKGFPNGIDQLELHESNDILYGESNIQSLAMALSYFHLINWNADDYAERAQKVYRKSGLGEGNDEGSFHGYTCRIVKDFGYIMTFVLNAFYFVFIRNNTKGRKYVSLGKLTIFVFLLVEPVNSIFYGGYDFAPFPILFYILIMAAYFFRQSIRHACISLK